VEGGGGLGDIAVRVCVERVLVDRWGGVVAGCMIDVCMYIEKVLVDRSTEGGEMPPHIGINRFDLID
jgi:hypothetical protein